MKKPEIKIQLVHIDGPFKGEINEYLSPVVTLGRHPDCDVIFPEEQRGISRRHAEIRREGNRFLLRDTSRNGTFVNGKQNEEVFLKSGDVLILGPGGPKISFLTTILEFDAGDGDQDIPVPPNKEPISEQQPISISVAPSEISVAPSPSLQKKNLFSVGSVSRQEPIAHVQKSLIIQHGAVIKAFKSLPITLGKGSDCDFIVNEPSILEHHAQLLFEQGQYWIKDLTGRNLLSLNMQTIQTKSPLLPDTFLSLSPQGPKFQFLGEGRLVEVEAVLPKQPDPQPSAQQNPRSLDPDSRNDTQKMVIIGGLLALCIGVAIVIYMVKLNDVNTLKEFLAPLPVDKVTQFIKHLLGRG
jgi:pSer/pThr/pTyr-binding forkhead associated (FHA) protein